MCHLTLVGCQFTFFTHVCVHVWTCVLSERLLFGSSITVLIFRAGSSLLGTTVKTKRMNKISELEIWDI